MFSWQWYVIYTISFSLNYTKLLLSYNKPAFGILVGAQLDLLSWMEANDLQTQLFPGAQWVSVPPVWQLLQSCQLTQRLPCWLGTASKTLARARSHCWPWSSWIRHLVSPQATTCGCCWLRQDVDLSLLAYSPSWLLCLGLTYAITGCGLAWAVTTVAWDPW